MKPAILISGEKEHLNVIKQFSVQENCEIIIFRNSLVEELSKENISYIDFNEFLDSNAQFDTEVYSNSNFQQWVNSLNSYNLQKQFSFVGEIFFLQMKEILEKNFQDEFPNLIFIIEGFKKLLESYDLKVSIFQNDISPINKTLIRISQKFEIPTFCILANFPVNRILFEKVITDKIAVSSDSAKDWFLQNGEDESKFLITGNPIWDKFYNFPLDKEIACDVLGINSQKPVVVFATARLGTLTLFKEEEEILNRLKKIFFAVKEARKKLDFEVIFKIPENETDKTIDKYFALLKECEIGDDDFFIFKDADPMMILASADLVINTRSNIFGIEALLVGKVVITLMRDGVFKDGDAVIFAESQEELTDSIIETLTDETMSQSLNEISSETIERINQNFDGRATQRVVNEINKIAGFPSQKFNLTSIIIVTENNEDSIQDCIRSIRKYTRLDYEIIVIDNNSTDKTVEILKSERNLTIIENSKNFGTVSGFNQGIKASEGDFIVFLSPKVRVSKNWLTNLVSNFDVKTGAVAPLAKVDFSEQNLNLWFDDSDKISDFENLAENVNKQNLEQTEIANFLLDFCLFTSREILEKINFFDERFSSLPNAMDFALKVRNLDLTLLIAKDTLVDFELTNVDLEEEIATEEFQTQSEILVHKLNATFEIDVTVEQFWGIDWFKEKQKEEKIRLVNLDDLVSVIVEVDENLDFTKACIQSLLENTSQNYELIFIDNSKNLETANYLLELEESTLIRNKDNIKALKQAFLKSSGEFILFMQNDVLVSKNWLSNIFSEITENTGLVTALSNVDFSLSYENFEDFRKFQNEIENSDNEVEEIENLSIPIFGTKASFLENFNKEVFEGNFIENFQNEVKENGFQLLCSQNSYVHSLKFQNLLEPEIDEQEVLTKKDKIVETVEENEIAEFFDENNENELIEESLETDELIEDFEELPKKINEPDNIGEILEDDEQEIIDSVETFEEETNNEESLGLEQDSKDISKIESEVVIEPKGISEIEDLIPEVEVQDETEEGNFALVEWVEDEEENEDEDEEDIVNSKPTSEKIDSWEINEVDEEKHNLIILEDDNLKNEEIHDDETKAVEVETFDEIEILEEKIKNEDSTKEENDVKEIHDDEAKVVEVETFDEIEILEKKIKNEDSTKEENDVKEIQNEEQSETLEEIGEKDSTLKKKIISFDAFKQEEKEEENFDITNEEIPELKEAMFDELKESLSKDQEELKSEEIAKEKIQLIEPINEEIPETENESEPINIVSAFEAQEENSETEKMDLAEVENEFRVQRLNLFTNANSEEEIAEMMQLFTKIKDIFPKTKFFFTSKLIEESVENFQEFNAGLVSIGIHFVMLSAVNDALKITDLFLNQKSIQLPEGFSIPEIEISLNEKDNFVKIKILHSLFPSKKNVKESEKNVSLTACLLTYNSEETLKLCLESINEFAQEIIIIDVGSYDNTFEIAKDFGAKVLHFEVEEEISTSRNKAISEATKDWILFIEPDQIIHQNDIDKLKSLMSKSTFNAFTVIEKSENGFSESCRIFKRDSRYFFQSNDINGILPSIKGLRHNILDTTIEFENIENKPQSSLSKILSFIKK
ncbi:MAG: glycosyltransferase [Calditrichaeota bacterium]|nr:MAG: glycosyltransferase [Calditrichota bacterium]